MSRVFGYDRAVGMHLHEYTHRELTRHARGAGFSRVLVPFAVPAAVRRRVPVPLYASSMYAGYLRAVEAALDLVPPARRERVARALKVPLFTRTLRFVLVR